MQQGERKSKKENKLIVEKGKKSQKMNVEKKEKKEICQKNT